MKSPETSRAEPQDPAELELDGPDYREPTQAEIVLAAIATQSKLIAIQRHRQEQSFIDAMRKAAREQSEISPETAA